MKKKHIVASTIGLLGITSMIISTITLAGNTTTTHGFGSGQRMGMGSKQSIIAHFSNSEEAQAFRAEIETAIEKKDYTAFKTAHTKYGITTYATETEFNEMFSRKTTQDKIKTALENGDYTTWKTLTKDHPIAKIIDTEAKFKQLQEIHNYQEKARAIAESLGLPGSKGEYMGTKKGPRGMGMGKGIHNQTNQ